VLTPAPTLSELYDSRFNPEIAAVNIGIADPAQLDESLAAVDLGPLPDDALARLDGLYDSDFDRAD